MMPQSTPSAKSELQELRHRYNRLCARFAQGVEVDPAAAARAIQELQSLSDRIVAIEIEDEMATREEEFSDPASNRPGGGAAQDSGRSAGVAAGDEAVPRPIPPQEASDQPFAQIVALRASRVRRPGESGPPELPPSLMARPAEVSARSGSEAVAVESGTELPAPFAAAPSTAPDFDRVYVAIKRQETQIDAVLRRCEEHQRQLEAMEHRLAAERHPADRIASQVESLAAGLEHERHRITTLAVAVQRMLHWLAAERDRGAL